MGVGDRTIEKGAQVPYSLLPEIIEQLGIATKPPQREKAVERADPYFSVPLKPTIKGERGPGRGVIVSNRERALRALHFFTGDPEHVEKNLGEAMDLVGAHDLEFDMAMRAAVYETLIPMPAPNKKSYFRYLLDSIEAAGVRPEIVDELTEDVRSVAEKKRMDVFPEVVKPCHVGSALRFMDCGPAFTIRNMVLLDKFDIKSYDVARAELQKVRRLRDWAETQDKADKKFLKDRSAHEVEEAYGTDAMIRLARNLLRLPILNLAEEYVGLDPETGLRLGGRNAEWAIASAARDLAVGLGGMSGSRMVGDYRSVANELIKQIRGQDPTKDVEKIKEVIKGLDKHTTIVADDLTPEIAKMISEHTEMDTVVFEREEMTTSHSAILLKNSDVRVAYSPGCLEETSTGDLVYVDCFSPKMTFTVGPTRKTKQEFGGRFEEFRKQVEFLRSLSTTKPVKTKDGVNIEILGNVDRKSNLAKACERGINGVGMCRSEVGVLGLPLDLDAKGIEDALYTQYSDFVSEYRRHEKSRTRQPIVIRLFDFGRGKPNPFSRVEKMAVSEQNQGAQFLLNNPELTAAQIRAFDRVNALDGHVHFEIPFYDSLKQVQSIVDIAENERSKMTAEGVKFRPCRIGVLIERKKALSSVDSVLSLKNIEFGALGTNDLGAEMLPTTGDREEDVQRIIKSNPTKDPLYPTTLEAIRKIFKSGEEHGKSIISCGEMGADDVGVALLIGLGARRLSMSPQMRRSIAYLISTVSVKDLEEIADESMKLKGRNLPEIVREFVQNKLREKGASLQSRELGDNVQEAESKMTSDVAGLLEHLKFVPVDAFHRGTRDALLKKMRSANVPESYISKLDKMPKSDVVKGPDGMYYYCRKVENMAGGGIHARVILALNQHVSEGDRLEVFSPRKADAGRMSGFEAFDTPSLQGSAENGDIVYFRSPNESGLKNVENFFRTTRLAIEVSRGD